MKASAHSGYNNMCLRNMLCLSGQHCSHLAIQIWRLPAWLYAGLFQWGYTVRHDLLALWHCAPSDLKDCHLWTVAMCTVCCQRLPFYPGSDSKPLKSFCSLAQTACSDLLGGTIAVPDKCKCQDCSAYIVCTYTTLYRKTQFCTHMFYVCAYTLMYTHRLDYLIWH